MDASSEDKPTPTQRLEHNSVFSTTVDIKWHISTYPIKTTINDDPFNLLFNTSSSLSVDFGEELSVVTTTDIFPFKSLSSIVIGSFNELY